MVDRHGEERIMIELFACGSPNVAKVLFMLSETNLPYRVTPVDIAEGGQYQDSFVALNPNSKVPVIIDDDGPAVEPYTVFESGAILLYLAEKADMLMPADSDSKHIVYQWLFFQASSLGPMCGQERHFAQSAPEEGNRYALRRYTAEVRRLLDVLDKRLAENEYLAGDSFTVADVAAFPGVQLHTDLMGGRWGRPNMVRWLDRIDGRAGYRKVKPVVLDLQARDAEGFAKAGPDRLDRFFGRGAHAKYV